MRPLGPSFTDQLTSPETVDEANEVDPAESRNTTGRHAVFTFYKQPSKQVNKQTPVPHNTSRVVAIRVVRRGATA